MVGKKIFNEQGRGPKGRNPEGWRPLGPRPFLELAHDLPILDVRSPKEFSHGHIPGALNLPLFNDQERAIVGTTYVHQDRDAAIREGLKIVGPKLDYFVASAHAVAKDKTVLVHCWRGGMRSEAMAWLLQFSGLTTHVLEGGYKAFRHYIHEAFSTGPPIIVLGGMTGSGKTELLQYLSSQGEQVVDLEGIANHKGSAFGSLGQPDQPSQEQFENDLAANWIGLDPSKPVWLEDESRNIGKVILPESLFLKMSRARVVCIEMDFDDRVERLVREYGSFDPVALSSIIIKIQKRIGGDTAQKAMKALESNDIRGAVEIILKYYDKTYSYGLSKRTDEQLIRVGFGEFRKGFAELRRVPES